MDLQNQTSPLKWRAESIRFRKDSRVKLRMEQNEADLQDAKMPFISSEAEPVHFLSIDDFQIDPVTTGNAGF